MTDKEVGTLLTTSFKTVVPSVWEGVYTGEEYSKYITFVYTVRGVNFANDRPTAKSYFITATLWVRVGVSAFEEKEKMLRAINDLGGTYPICEYATDNEWKQYVYQFYYICGVDDEV